LEDASPRPFWAHPALLAALVIASAVPLLWPNIPPLVDLPGHMGRYRVQLDIAHSPTLRHYYDFSWALIGNLGIDLLIIPFAKLFGLELGVKLIVTAIPVMTAAGFLWVAREVHGRIPPTALFALPLAYNFPFLFGFVNFALSMAFAFLAFALWLRLARLGRLKLRAALFVPISLVIWIAHTYGWGTLGVLAFSAELVRQHDHGRSPLRAGINAACHCLPMSIPFILMLLWRNGAVSGSTGDWFNLMAKFQWVVMALRDRWRWFDLGAVALLLTLILAAIGSRRIGFSRNLAASALFLALVFVVLPRVVFGSAYADMRLVPYMIAVGVLAIRMRPSLGVTARRAIAMAGLAFFLLRTGATTWSFYLYDGSYDRELTAVDRLPYGARLVSFVGTRCVPAWPMTRLEHLPGLALVRREAFSNDQWSMAGAQLLIADYPAGRGFSHDPTQIVTLVPCHGESWRTIGEALDDFPRKAFDYVWLIRPPPYDPRLAQGLQPIWRSGSSVLYRVVDRSPPLAGLKDHG